MKKNVCDHMVDVTKRQHVSNQGNTSLICDTTPSHRHVYHHMTRELTWACGSIHYMWYWASPREVDECRQPGVTLGNGDHGNCVAPKGNSQSRSNSCVGCDIGVPGVLAGHTVCTASSLDSHYSHN